VAARCPDLGVPRDNRAPGAPAPRLARSRAVELASELAPGELACGMTSGPGPCFCREGAPLCSFCVDATLTRKFQRLAERLGDTWGRSVYRRRPVGAWPTWDTDTSGNLRPTAFRLVAHLHRDPGVLDRLARTCAYHAAVAYRDEAKRCADGTAP